MDNDRIKNTFWGKLEDRDLDELEDTLFKLGIYDEMDSAFGCTQAAPDITKQKDQIGKDEEIKILDHRKAQNISKLLDY